MTDGMFADILNDILDAPVGSAAGSAKAMLRV